jgi:hypothetical protein
MKKYLVVLLLLLAFVINCEEESAERRIVVSKEFIDSNTFEIVVNGYPKESLQGIARSASAKRAALLNAYIQIKKEFDDSVAPDRDGSVKKFEFGRDRATVYYTVKKRGLKSRLRK